MFKSFSKPARLNDAVLNKCRHTSLFYNKLEGQREGKVYLACTLGDRIHEHFGLIILLQCCASCFSSITAMHQILLICNCISK